MDFYTEKPWQFCLHLLIKETFTNIAFEGCEPQSICVEHWRFIELTKADCKFPEILSQLSHIYCGKSVYSDPFLRERNTEKHPLGYFLSKRKEKAGWLPPRLYNMSKILSVIKTSLLFFFLILVSQSLANT